MEGVATERVGKHHKSHVVLCDCGNTECALTEHIELWPGEYDLSVIHYAKFQYAWWNISRWKCILKLLFTGKIEFAHDMALSHEAARNWVNTINKAVEELEVAKNEKSMGND